MVKLQQLVTINEACEMLRISRPTLFAHMHSGKLPSVRIGKRRLFVVDDLAEFIERNRVNGKDEA